MDELERLNSRAGGAFLGHLDLPRVAVLGHPLGGLVAIVSEGGTRNSLYGGRARYADNVACNGDQKTGSDSVRGARAMER